MDSIPFSPPERRAMSDADLQEALGSAKADQQGIEAAMWLLDTESALREEDKIAFQNWADQMLSIGSPEALRALENANRAAQGLPPIEQTPTPETQPEPVYEPTPEPPSVDDPFDLDAFELLLSAEKQAASAPVESIDDVYGAEEEFTALEEAAQARLPEPTPIHSSASVDLEESASIDSTPKSSRTGRASFQFWSWLGLTGSLLPLGAAAYLSTLEISFGQSVLALLLGVFVSAGVVAIGALAGKRSGLPTVLLSRAAFGVFANHVPAAFLLLARVLVLLSIGAFVYIAFSNSNASPAGFESLLDFEAQPLNLIALIVVTVIAASAVALAIFGGHILYQAQKVIGILGAAVFLVVVAVNLQSVSWAALSSKGDGSWLATFGAAILIFSVFGLAWVGTGADFARKLPVTALGIKVVGWGLLSLAVVPAIIGVFALSLVGSKADTFAVAFQDNFVMALAEDSGPILYWVILLSVASSLTVVLAMALYSASLTAHSLNIKMRPLILQPILGLLVIFAAVLASLHLGSQGFWFNFSGYSLSLAVPVGAWAGVFVSDVLIRRIAYHEVSLTRSYGFYKPVNWINFGGWIIAVIVGFGLIHANPKEFFWQGYLLSLSANPGFWQASSFGIVIAFSIGLLLPVTLGIPRIKRQEAEVLSIEARKNDLKDIFGFADMS